MAIGNSPTKGSNIYAWAGLSTDAKPANAFIGQKVIETDTGLVFEWDGANWCPRISGVEIDSLVKSIPTTGTFHHLGHEGKVFIHSERHNGIADAASLDVLVRMPASNANRQVHFRFNTLGKANTGTLDVDITLYEDITVSADGSAETQIASTNDTIVKTTGVLLFDAPTITDLGNLKARVALFGEKKSTSSQDMAVPEWIMAPNGASARDYLLRATNNSGGTVDIVHNLFWYDSEAI